MKTIKASAPSKVIIAGEHFVVYGATAIAAPLNNRKTCECEFEKCEKGEGHLDVDDSMGNGKYLPDGNFEDTDGWFKAKARVIGHILKTEGRDISDLKIKMHFSKNAIPKGTGHSAATAAVLALCLYGVFGIKPGKQKLFDAVQAFEEVAHGGRASGIDAQTVISDKPQEYRKIFKEAGQVASQFEDVDLKLPKNAVLLVINTLRKGETPQTTGELIAQFAKKNGIEKKPNEMSDSKRQEVVAPYEELLEKMTAQLSEKGDVKLLGKLLDENQGLLKKSGVSSEGIEIARGICKKNGAYGSKITGAGGRGGAIIAICEKGRAGKILAAIRKEGMEGVEAQFSKEGARLE